MGLWDEEDDDFECQASDMNEYLENPDKGIELIAKLLSYEKKSNFKRRAINKLNYLLDRKLLEVSGKINLSNELDLYNRLIILSDKLSQQNKVRLLKNKTVIGIGGKFSAGKSKFINALLNSDILPEDQTPTTSIATYIVHEQNEDIRAYTYNDQDIPLDMQGAQALTHAFYKKYGIGFSQFINNLVINVPDFPFENVALLDTPGYSKADSGIKKSVSDAQKAYSQLKTVDFLIWLVDIENGVIQQADIDFIRSLGTKNPVLIVFNKADKKTQKDVQNIVETSKNILEHTGINIADVIAYSALEAQEYLGTDKLSHFFLEANQYTNRNEDIEKQIMDIRRTISREFDSARREVTERRNKIGNIIFRSEDIMEIKTLVQMYADAIEGLNEINAAAGRYREIEKDIDDLLMSISKE